MFSLVEAFLLLSYTGMVYVLSCRGFLVVIVHSPVEDRTQGWCMFSLVEAFLLLSCMFSPVGFLDVIVHRDGVCSLL